MKNQKLFILFFIFIFTIFYSCKKETETFPSLTLQEYFPLTTGSVFYYRLDSIVIAPFGTSLITKYYEAKDSIESEFLDNTNRKSFRIFRFIRDTLAVQSWRFAATYVATADTSKKQLEFVDNNFRFIKLKLPTTEFFTWKGNSFIDTKSINSTVQYLDDWNYEYKNVGSNYSVKNKIYSNTITVEQNDETNPLGPFNPASFQTRNFGEEVYAKGIGLIYKNFLHWTWQTTPPPAKYEDGSYGIKLQLISYNLK